MHTKKGDRTLPFPRGSTEGADSESTRVLGVRVNNVSMASALDIVMGRVAGDHASMVVFVNAHCMNGVFADREYLSVLNRADCVFADGIGMRLVGWWLGQPIRENVNGTDMFPLLCARMENTGYRVFLLGGRPGVAEKVRDWIEDHHPGVRISGTHHGYFNEDSTKKVIDAVRRARTDLLLVAFGVPAQEKWLARNLDQTGASVGMGVGGLFDFFSGGVRRAPAWMRAAGLEWTYRLIQEPARLWRRYLIGNPLFLWRAFRRRSVT